MTLNFQNKLIFPAPENSYTTETAYGQVIYIPRDIMQRAKQRARHGYPLFRGEPGAQARTILGGEDAEESHHKPDHNPDEMIQRRSSLSDKLKVQSHTVVEGRGDNDGADLPANIDSPKEGEEIKVVLK